MRDVVVVMQKAKLQAELPFRAGRDPSVAGITHPFDNDIIASAALGAKSDPGAATTTSVPCHVHIHNGGKLEKNMIRK
tara:strand:- start:489 stop:722 length:234 start_codon:yes stop_codon:yes gene_type:complete